jgi:hypothetical protein
VRATVGAATVRRWAVAGRVAVALVVLAVAAAGAPLASFTRPAAAAPGDGPVTMSHDVSRTHLEASGNVTVDTRHVSVTATQTVNLRGRQQITVSWTGAHPTGGIVGDPNRERASHQEYPMVLMECRGIDSGNQHIDPSTCWVQTWEQRYQDSAFPFPEWRVDRYAQPEERTAVVDAPDPGACVESSAVAKRYVPFVEVSGKVDHFGPLGRCAMPAEASVDEDPATPPSNTTYAVTDADGNGSTRFVISTAQENASLGCSNAVPCSLVAIPIMGISCDTAPAGLPYENQPPDEIPAQVQAQAEDQCTKKGRYAPGEPASSDASKDKGDPAVGGALWWSASNWRGRISIPLTFAPPPNACDITDTRTPLDVYGSELMDQAFGQWAALFCKDPRAFKLRHVPVGEPLAKTALQSQSINGAMFSVSPDGGFGAPTVTSPVAVTGFAISYAIDDAAGHEYTSLRLTPRLVAKLLSESYWALPDLQRGYAALDKSEPYHAMATNPSDMSRDPEFIALNPGIGPTTAIQGAATMLVLAGNSDVTYALTSWLNADPEARAFLDGKPDPWGMVVNPSYRQIPLPQESWPLLDTFKSKTITFGGCIDPTNAPVPILPLIAAPMSGLLNIAQAMEYALGNSNTNCVQYVDQGGFPVPGGVLKPAVRQQPGSRFMLSLTALSDTALLGLRPAQLQTTSQVSNLTAKFSDATSRSFVGPTDTAIAKAVQQSTMDTVTRTWPIPYDKLRTVKDAYPGAMLVYLAAPATKLDRTTATQVGYLMSYAATKGQEAGQAEGQLPPGYVPMTAANGLGDLAAYAQLAAAAVAAQKGDVDLNLLPPATPGGPEAGGPGTGDAGGVPLPNPGVAPVPAGSPSPIFPPWTPAVQLPAAYTARVRSATAGWTLPLAALAALLAIGTAVGIRAGAGMWVRSAVRLRMAYLAELRKRR